ncbi:hypothetical protein [Caproiciproducens sp.]|uniref:hypothetical protein n=1 Tax=Caproiciproducens sp. TaxID=1954376 RepID=UPI0028970795|nr:hypothetical protein [Caproiciproducens sp.]
MTKVDYISEKDKDGHVKIRVLLNGTDISDCVVSADFEGGSGKLSFIRLKCYAHKIDVNGDFDADVHR